MRIVFDAYWWVEGPLSNQMVQRQFISTWVRDYPEDEAVLLVPAAHVEATRGQVADDVRVEGTRLRPHALAAMVALPALARRVSADLALSHNFTPVAGPAITFIHDVLFRTNPEWFTRAERMYLSPIPPLARRALAIATSSAHEADRIRESVPRLRRVEAVGITLSDNLSQVVPQRPADMPPVDNYALTVGRLNVRKNLARTIEGAIASGTVSPERPLIVVGEADGRAAGLGSAGDDGSVVFLSRVNDAGLAWLYAHTALFVFLSLDEGYGLPPVEAARFGAPVLVSDIPLFHETIGSRATFVDPLDSTAIAAGFSHLLESPRPMANNDPTSQLTDDWSACTRRLRDLALQAIADR